MQKFFALEREKGFEKSARPAETGDRLSRAGGGKSRSKSKRPIKAVPRLAPIQVARFWSKVEVDRFDDQCWNWRGKTSGDGYGQFQIYGDGSSVVHRAHRIAHTLVNGAIPPGLFILHSCDNPLCCNPRHLRAGTAQDNSDDMVERGRARTGRAKLSEEDVRYIRENTDIPGVKLARRFGVAKSTISMLRTGKTYRGASA